MNKKYPCEGFFNKQFNRCLKECDRKASCARSKKMWLDRKLLIMECDKYGNELIYIDWDKLVNAQQIKTLITLPDPNDDGVIEEKATEFSKSVKTEKKKSKIKKKFNRIIKLLQKDLIEIDKDNKVRYEYRGNVFCYLDYDKEDDILILKMKNAMNYHMLNSIELYSENSVLEDKISYIFQIMYDDEEIAIFYSLIEKMIKPFIYYVTNSLK